MISEGEQQHVEVSMQQVMQVSLQQTMQGSPQQGMQVSPQQGMQVSPQQGMQVSPQQAMQVPPEQARAEVRGAAKGPGEPAAISLREQFEFPALQGKARGPGEVIQGTRGANKPDPARPGGSKSGPAPAALPRESRERIKRMGAALAAEVAVFLSPSSDMPLEEHEYNRPGRVVRRSLFDLRAYFPGAQPRDRIPEQAPSITPEQFAATGTDTFAANVPSVIRD